MKGSRLPLAFLHRYTAFLLRRPVSRSNFHYLATRLEGLKSLAPLLEDEGTPGAGPVTGLLRRLNVPNFPRLAPQLLDLITPLVRDELPSDVVVSPGPPPGDALAACRRILIVLGPGIGVGDEIMCFALPRWLRRAAPGAEVATLSAYPGLWDRVADVARCRSYDRYSDAVEALRNDGAEADLVVLVDFEDPALHPLILPEPGVGLYLEISIAGRSAVLVDCERRWLHRLLLPGPYDVNYYQALSGIAEWLGCGPRPGDRAGALERNGAGPPAGELCILVSPFTSKHEPSELYWSKLLAGAVPRRSGLTRMVFDPGPNAFTGRFARSLARSTQARCPHPVRCEVIGDREPGPVSLQGVFAAMEGVHAVVCVDSFAAHAAALFGCVSLVVGWTGLENWRVPLGPSFYFDGSAPVGGTASAMRHVLGAVHAGSNGSAAGRLTRAQSGLAEAAERLGAVLSDGAVEPVALAAACNRFFEAYLGGLDESDIEAPGAAELFRDYPYAELRLPRLPADASAAAGEREAVERHLRHLVRQWQATNLSKYLELVRAAAHGPEVRA